MENPEGQFENYLFQLGAEAAQAKIEKHEDGYEYGEWNSAGSLRSEDLRVRMKAKLGSVEGVTNYGGERSKYSMNEDNLFVVAHENQLAVGVIDGAGGSGNGSRASSII